MRLAKSVFLLLVVSQFAFSQPALETVDTSAINRIKDEELNRSHAMELESWLADVYGERLTGSPQFTDAAEWAVKKLTEWGITNVHMEEWKPFGRGWELKHFSATMTDPKIVPLIGYPKAWSPGLPKTLRTDAVYLDVKNESELENYRGKLKGKIVLISNPADLPLHFEPLATRQTAEELLKLANASPSAQRRRYYGGGFRLLASKLAFCQKEGAAVVIDAGHGDGGTLMVMSANVPQTDTVNVPYDKRPKAYDANAPKIPPQITLAAEHYNRIVRILQKGIPVRLELNLDVEFTGEQPGYNVIGEIPGTDLKDQIVMLGAHLDSWHAGTGACDNGTGVICAMEAVRLLRTLNLQPRRTIRIALWGGEEEGLLGSKAYVQSHFATQDSANPRGITDVKPEYDKLSVYFNDDNGSGKFRGIYLQGNVDTRPIFRSWFTQLADDSASTISASNTGGTDHLSFDRVGLPGFQFIQDQLEYWRSYHSNMDVYERVSEPDLKQSATIMASFVYEAAMRNGMFPRKALPSLSK